MSALPKVVRVTAWAYASSTHTRASRRLVQASQMRLVQHAPIPQASVVGIPEPKYGEVVGAFPQQRSKVPRPSNEELWEFVGQTLG
jgi:hypothetical protein